MNFIIPTIMLFSNVVAIPSPLTENFESTSLSNANVSLDDSIETTVLKIKKTNKNFGCKKRRIIKNLKTKYKKIVERGFKNPKSKNIEKIKQNIVKRGIQLNNCIEEYKNWKLKKDYMIEEFSFDLGIIPVVLFQPLIMDVEELNEKSYETVIEFGKTQISEIQTSEDFQDIVETFNVSAIMPKTIDLIINTEDIVVIKASQYLTDVEIKKFKNRLQEIKDMTNTTNKNLTSIKKIKLKINNTINSLKNKNQNSEKLKDRIDYLKHQLEEIITKISANKNIENIEPKKKERIKKNIEKKLKELDNNITKYEKSKYEINNLKIQLKNMSILQQIKNLDDDIKKHEVKKQYIVLQNLLTKTQLEEKITKLMEKISSPTQKIRKNNWTDQLLAINFNLTFSNH